MREDMSLTQQVEQLVTTIRRGNEPVPIQILPLDDLTEEEKKTVKRIVEQMKTKEAPPNMRYTPKKRLNEEVCKVNQILEYIQTKDITSTNELLKAAGCIVAQNLGYKKRSPKERKEPWWKKRIKGKIASMRKDLSRLDRWNRQELSRTKIQEALKKKYHIPGKKLNVVIEELKQRISANTAKLKRYEARTEQFQQNRLFELNQKKLFEQLEKRDDEEKDPMPEKEDAVNFWSEIWDKPVTHNHEATWLEETEQKLESTIQKQINMKITPAKLKAQTRKMKKWKSPGPDGLQSYWIKVFTKCHDRLCLQLQDCLDKGETPEWMTKGRTALIIKDKAKGNDVANYRPITCLPLMWKLLTAIISNEMYEYLEENELLPEEQKGCRRNSRGTKDQLLIDKMIMKNCKRRHTGLGMAWIDYKKAYDMIPHSWIKKCMDMFGVADNIQKVIGKSMETWRTNLTANGEDLGEVKIRRGIFQGDSLSPLLFVLALVPLSLVLRKVKDGYDLGGNKGKVNHLLFMDDLKVYGKNENQVDNLVNTVRIFSKDIGMEFGITKCAMLTMKRGKKSKSEGIELPDGQLIKNLEDEDAYKYLGILEADTIKNKEMKATLTKEYFRRIRKVLKSKLNGGNIISAINSRAVSLIRYGAGIIKWTREELRIMDRKTRKLLTTYRSMHPQADVDRLYLKRKNGGRGMISVEDCIDMETCNLKKYIQESKEGLLKTVENEGVLGDGKTKEEVMQTRKTTYLAKPLHAQFYLRTEDDRDEASWNWLKNGNIKKETEGLLLAAQDQALRSNAIKSRIDKMDVSPMCRLCGEREENVSHIVAECKMLAQKQYKLWRHDRVALVAHWQLCQISGFNAHKKWYEHESEAVLENEVAKILWDFPIQTDHRLEHNKPDIVYIDKMGKTCYIIDVACPFDTRIKQKEMEKIERYQDLKREIKKIWKYEKVYVVPIVIGALGTIGKNFDKWTKMIGLERYKDLMQQACLLGTAKILRKVLDT